MKLKSVNVPEEMIPLFQKAEDYVKDYFASFATDREKGTITIGGERYILVRAKSLRVDFEKHLSSAAGIPDDMAVDAANNFLYILAKSIGQEDAKHFVQSQNVSSAIEKLAAGPIAFNYTGWAFVDINKLSKPATDDSYLLIYDHPYSFEAEAFIKARGIGLHAKCIMNAGYSAGWCSESFGIDVHARELLCKAKGDHTCRFVMGVQSKLDEYARWAMENIKD